MDEKKAEVWNDENNKSLKVITKCVTTTVAIVALCYLEAQALAAGIDGILFTGVIAAVAGLGGYELKSIIERKK